MFFPPESCFFFRKAVYFSGKLFIPPESCFFFRKAVYPPENAARRPFSFLWQEPFMAQQLQPQPHELFPRFLSLIRLKTMQATIAIITRETTMVPALLMIT